jgi:hypothetical protein
MQRRKAERAGGFANEFLMHAGNVFSSLHHWCGDG